MKGQIEDHVKTIGASAGERARVLPILENYLQRSGLPMQEFARRINYSRESLKAFRSDRYHMIAGTHIHLCQVIEEYIKKNPIDLPQQIFGELYDTTNVRVIRETIQRLLPRPTAYMIYAPPGSEKSFAIEYEIARLNREQSAKGNGRCAFYVYAEEKVTPAQLMKELALACGSAATGDKTRIARNLGYDFRNRRVLLAIDEAQHLDISCLETLRRLLDRPPNFSLLLAGSHDLRMRFDKSSASLEQWNSRVIDKVLLPGVTRDEARGIAHREIGLYLDRLDQKKAAALVEKLIDAATVKDAFNQKRPYINIRTLCNALDQIKYEKSKRAQ
jgi:DNA transposition AAA+ family ATPase